MQRLKSGAAFFKEVWQAAREQPSLLAPALWTFGAGLALTMLAVLVTWLVLANGRSLLLAALIGFALAAAFILATALGYTISAATSHRFYSVLNGQTPSNELSNAALRHSGGELLLFALASPLMRLLPAKPEDDWKRAAYLVLPVAANTGLSIGDSLLRVSQMVRANLLRIGEGLVGARALARLAGGLLSIPLGVSLGLFIIGLFLSAALAFGYFLTSTYDTCLYQWAASLERSRGEAQGAYVSAPPMLAVALSTAG